MGAQRSSDEESLTSIAYKFLLAATLSCVAICILPGMLHELSTPTAVSPPNRRLAACSGECFAKCGRARNGSKCQCGEEWGVCYRNTCTTKTHIWVCSKCIRKQNEEALETKRAN